MKKFLITAAILITLLSGFYIFQVNTLASEQAQVQGEGQRIEELKSENETLQINLANKSSFKRLEEQIVELGFEKAERASYIRALETWVAVK